MLITTQGISNQRKQQKKKIESDFYLGFTNYIKTKDGFEIQFWTYCQLSRTLWAVKPEMLKPIPGCQALLSPCVSISFCFTSSLWGAGVSPGVGTCYSYSARKNYFLKIIPLPLGSCICQAIAHFQNFPFLNPAFLLTFRKIDEILVESWRILFTYNPNIPVSLAT